MSHNGFVHTVTTSPGIFDNIRKFGNFILIIRDVERNVILEILYFIPPSKGCFHPAVIHTGSIIPFISTFANHGEVEIVRRAVDFISEYNARVRKPVITPRNKFFQLPELAERMRERLKAVQSRENKEVPFEGGTLVWNYGEDRLQILFDRIPEDNRRKELKSSGFRWSPRNKAWQRQLTSNALSAAKRVLNLQNI